MMCHKGGLPTLRHNEVRDLTAALLSEACTGVSVEPSLQALDHKQFSHRSANCDDDARFDIQASNFWSKGQKAFFDIRVFYPIAPSYQQKELATIYKLHENDKKRCYGQKMHDVEMASFTQLVFCLNRRNGQGVYYLFQVSYRHLGRKEENRIPEDAVPDPVQDLIFFATIINWSDQGH